MEFFYKTHYKLSPKNKPPLIVGVYKGLSGERGIRTPGGVTLNSFQDCRIRPLCHFSIGVANIHDFENKKIIETLPK